MLASGKITKTAARRKTRVGRNAVVHTAGQWRIIPDSALHRCETKSMFGDAL
jgi:hypothetical protein